MSEERYLKQVIILRKDLGLRKGKMIAQGCHASRGAAKLADEQNVSNWERKGETKIVVGINGEENLLDLYKEMNSAGLPTKLVRDHGHTEIEEGTMTAVGVGPSQNEKIDEFTSNLSLL